MKIAQLRKQRLRQVVWLVFSLLTIITIGTVGYHVFLGWGLVESLYMTIITITTVGYGEIYELGSGGQIFTILLILSSVGVVAYGATTITSLVMETQFRSLLWRHRMEQKIKEMRGHYIICGYGRTGRAVCESLTGHGLSFVVVENTAEIISELNEAGLLAVEGDASHDDSLERAGIKNAMGLVAALGGDAENVYLVLSARQLNPDLKIVSWSTSQEAEIKIKRAGADHVMSPYVLGGKRIATLLTTPHALEFFDHALFGKDQEIRLGEIEIEENSTIVGNSLNGLGIGREIGVILIGVRRAGGEMRFNPAADMLMEAGDIMICVGAEKQMEVFKKLLT